MDTNEKHSAITRFSLFFIKSFRVTLILFLAILLLGGLSYTQFLKREGFPAVEVPFVSVSVPYFVDDIEVVDEEIAQPLEAELATIEEVSRVSTYVNPNGVTANVEFLEGITSAKAEDILKQDLSQNLDVPENTELLYATFDAGTIDGTHDLLLDISPLENRSTSIRELQNKVIEVAAEVETLPEVQTAEAVLLVESRSNPVTGEVFDVQSAFNRVGIKENGELSFYPAVAVGVIKKSDVGIIDLSNAVREKINDLNGDLLEDYRVSYGADLADSLQDQISSLESNAMSGLIAVTIVLIFLVGLRAGFLGFIYIPTVLAGTFIVMYILGYSLNVISLFSLILVLGLFVDDAIVIIEAIDYQKQKGLKNLEAVKHALDRVGTADILGTLTTVLVFAPLLFTSGVLGEFIRLIPSTVIAALFVSLFIALTIVPLLARVVISDRRGVTREHRGSLLDAPLRDIFGYLSNSVSDFGHNVTNKFVGWYLQSKWLMGVMVVISIAFIAIGSAYASKLTFSVFPPPKDSVGLNISLTYDEGIDIDQAEDIALEVEEVIEEEIEGLVESVTYFFANQNSAFINLRLTDMQDREESTKDLAVQLQSELDDLENVEVKVDQESAGPPVSDFPFAMQVFGDDQDDLERAAVAIENVLLDLEIGGERVTDVRVTNLQTIAKIDGERFIQIQAKVSDPLNTGFILEVQEAIEDEFGTDELANLGLDEDALGFDFGQESENLQSFNSVIFALALAVILIYVLLVYEFKSFLQPILILFAVPLSFPGLFPGLYFTGNQLSFFVMLGISGLVGIVVNNSIMITDYANQMRKEGYTLEDAVMHAANVRFRPILATSLTTVAGLLPLALQDPFWEPLTFSIMFGLISSTVMVLLFFPLYYVLIERLRMWKDSIINR